MKLISWNINGIRAIMNKGFLDFVEKYDPDVLALQEIKSTEEQFLDSLAKGSDLFQENSFLPQYKKIWNPAERKGYSGTAVFTKKDYLSTSFGMETLLNHKQDLDIEGRITTVEFDKFFLVNVYTPNSKADLSRLDYRQIWDRAFLDYLLELQKKKPVITCGDFNVAHTEIDLSNPKQNMNNHGFTKEERQGFTNFVENGILDTFRIFNKEPNNYTWWSYFGNARQKNIGWRIDYFLASEILKDQIQNAYILPEVFGSDHCPVVLEIE